MSLDPRDRYHPTPIGAASVREEDGQWTLVLVREFAHPPERVWLALTDPAALREWAPFDAPRALDVTGPVSLVMAGADGSEVSEAVVTRAERPRLLEYTWEEDRLRWELTPTAAGTRVTLAHTVSDRSWLSRVAAGWHVCLDVAAHWLDGAPLGRIVGEDAKRRGWRALNRAYAGHLGVEAQPED
jgi:uncharacterized protein YndB with AHSA1/START domain